MSRCPKCNHSKAYIGVLFVECPNQKCEFFSTRSAEDYEIFLKKENEKNKLADLKNNDVEPDKKNISDPDKTPTYHWGKAKQAPLPDFSTGNYIDDDDLTPLD